MSIKMVRVPTVEEIIQARKREFVITVLSVFGRGPLREFTPCRFDSIDKIVKALAVVHTELLLIHPFRDGNGRVARLLATLMALQAELPPLDFGSLKGRRRKAYYAATQAGLDRDYKPMEDVFNGVIRKTLRKRKT